MRNVKVKRLTKTAQLPKRMSDGAAAFDIRSDEDTVVPTEGIRRVSTGIAMELSPYAGVLTHRSGQNSKGCQVYGLIDPDYRGEIIVCIHNNGLHPMRIKKGDRIAQLRLVELPDVQLIEGELNGTARDAGGFESTGLND